MNTTIGGAWVTPADPIDGDWVYLGGFYLSIDETGEAGTSALPLSRSMYVNSANSYALGDYDHPFGASNGGATIIGAGFADVDAYPGTSEPYPSTAAWNNGFIRANKILLGDDAGFQPPPYVTGQLFDGNGEPLEGAPSWSRDPASLGLPFAIEYESVHASSRTYDAVDVLQWTFRLTNAFSDYLLTTGKLHVTQEPFGKGEDVLVEDDPNDGQYDSVDYQAFVLPRDIGNEAYETYDSWSSSGVGDPPNTTWRSFSDYQDNSVGADFGYLRAGGTTSGPDAFVSQDGWFQRWLDAIVADGELVATLPARTVPQSRDWTVPHPAADALGKRVARIAVCHSTVFRATSEHPVMPDWTLSSHATDSPIAVWTEGLTDSEPRLLVRPHYIPARWRRIYDMFDPHVTPSPGRVNIPITLTLTPEWIGHEVINGITWTVDWADGHTDTGLDQLVFQHTYVAADNYTITITATQDSLHGLSSQWYVPIVDTPDLTGLGGSTGPGFYGKH